MLLGRVLLLTAAHSGRRRMAAQAQSCDAFEWHWLRETKSTQDAAKEILKQRVVGNNNGHDGKHVAVATAFSASPVCRVRKQKLPRRNFTRDRKSAETDPSEADAVEGRPLFVPLRFATQAGATLCAALEAVGAFTL